MRQVPLVSKSPALCYIPTHLMIAGSECKSFEICGIEGINDPDTRTWAYLSDILAIRYKKLHSQGIKEHQETRATQTRF